MFPLTKEQLNRLKLGCNCPSSLAVKEKRMKSFFQIETKNWYEISYDISHHYTSTYEDGCTIMDILKISCGYCGKVLWEKIRSYDEL